MKKIRLFVIGCTGSVGKSILDVCRTFPEYFEVKALAARSSVEEIGRLSLEFNPNRVILTDRGGAEKLRSFPGLQAEVMAGEDALEETAAAQDIDHVVVASSGTGAIGALASALKNGKDVSLANKESIVAAGEWIMPLISRPGQLRPLDSEHNAVWQCIGDRPLSQIAKITLTASGGPFRNFSDEELKKATPAMAVNHPVWNMGAKISVDSATLMNKGIEILEAITLFSVPADRIDAVICPESFVHGIVEFTDGSFLMSASEPDMRFPCASALFYPRRSPFPPARTAEIAGRTVAFSRPDEKLFPCLALAKEAARRGGPFPALLIGADESAVEYFLKGKIRFTDIPSAVESVLEGWRGGSPKSLDEALAILEEGKNLAAEFCRRI